MRATIISLHWSGRTIPHSVGYEEFEEYIYHWFNYCVGLTNLDLVEKGFKFYLGQLELDCYTFFLENTK